MDSLPARVALLAVPEVDKNLQFPVPLSSISARNSSLHLASYLIARLSICRTWQIIVSAETRHTLFFFSPRFPLPLPLLPSSDLDHDGVDPAELGALEQ
jgi:hypothetical protein